MQEKKPAFYLFKMELPTDQKQLGLFKIVIRDLRQKDQFKIDDKYITGGYARACGKYATCVYGSLCRYAEFNSQRAWPAQERIAYEHNIPVKQVRSGFKKLMEFNIIMAETNRIKGKFDNYTYLLIDKTQWKPITIGQNRPTANHRSKTAGGNRPTKDYKDLRITKSILTGACSGKQNDIEKLTEYYLTTKKISERPERFFRTAGDLLTLCNNSLECAQNRIKMTKKWAEKKGIEWGMDTTVKKFLEINII